MITQQLPDGWKMVRFGDIAKQCKESIDRENNPFSRYIEGGHMDSEHLTIRRWGEFSEDYVGPAFHRVFRKGQILYGSRRTYLKKVAVASFDGITANTTFVIEPIVSDYFDGALLPFIMLSDSFTKHSIAMSKGSTNPYINWKDISEYQFPLPPLEVQKSLAKIGNKIIEVENTAYAVESSLINLITSYTTEALCNTDNKLVSLSDLVDMQVGFPFKSKDFVEDGISLLRGANVGVCKPVWGDERKCIQYEIVKDYSDYMLDEGDVIVAMDRPFVGSGFKVSRIGVDDLPSLLVQRVGRFNNFKGISADFLWVLMNSHFMKGHLLSQQKGMDIPHLSKKEILSCLVPQIPLEKQGEIFGLYRNLEKIRDELSVKKEKLKKMQVQIFEDL